jgi:hypothetical protein
MATLRGCFMASSFLRISSAALLALTGCARATTTFEDASFAVQPYDGGSELDTGSIEWPDEDGDDGADDDADADGSGPVDEQDAGEGPEPRPDAGGPEPELDASQPESECKAGHYQGTFHGTINVLLVLNIPIEGDISIDVQASEQGDSLVIENGTVMGTDQDGNPVTADVVGTLDCPTKTLEDGELRNGVYVRESINQTIKFAGTVQATYHAGNPPTVSGTWSTQGGIESGSGPFNAVLAQ